MTREEAITKIEEQYKICQEFYNLSANPQKDYPDVTAYMEALDVALSELRFISPKQVEKGKWIDAYSNYSIAKCSKCEELFDVSDTGENLKVLFEAFQKYYRFCPSCGTHMTDEAVQTVMERLEALKGEKD